METLKLLNEKIKFKKPFVKISDKLEVVKFKLEKYFNIEVIKIEKSNSLFYGNFKYKNQKYNHLNIK